MMETRMLLPTILLLHSLSGGCQSAAATKPAPPSEFLRSFLNRPQLLPNAPGAKGPREPLSEDTLSFSVIVDNWSKYSLVYTQYAVTEGALEASFPPRNMAPKQRGFGARTTSRVESAGNVAGMVGWTLTDNSGGDKMSKLSVAWKASAKGTPVFALALGDAVPQFDDMWTEHSSSGLVGKISVDGSTLTVADSWTTVAARLARAKEKKVPHFNLHVSVIPQNVDPWGWVKYFKESGDAASKKKKKEKATSRRDRDEHGGQQKDSAAASAMAREDGEGKPLFQNKNLLAPGPGLKKLQEYEQTLRGALRESASGHSVAVGIHIENWTRFRLGLVRGAIESGKALASKPPPPYVDPGEQDVGIVTNAKGSVKGTSGVLRWTVGTQTDIILSVMWSVPYNRQLWNAWVAIGLTNGTLGYEQMYSGSDDTRFVRKRAGRGEFEFSDVGGKFIVIARMDDAGATFKPVLHLGLTPVDEQDLAADIKKQLGKSVSKADDMNVIKEPFELVQASGASSASLTSTAVLSVPLIAMLNIHRRR